MKTLTLFLLTVHGLIHLLGFVKAFGLAQPPQLLAPISRPLGLLWLAAAALLVAAAGMHLASSSAWWLPATLGVALSQILIFTAWNDAKAGTVVSLLLLAPVAIAAFAAAPWGFRAQYDRAVSDGLRQLPQREELLTRADIATLPHPVQRYLDFTGAVDRPRVWNYRLRFRGGLRNGPNDRWMAVTVDQHSFANPPARLFLVDSSMYGVPFYAFHRYIGPQALFTVKAALLLDVVDARGLEMNRSETVTLLNDMFLLAPATLIDPHIAWEELDANTIRATYTNAGNTVSAVVSFDASGALVNFVSDDRCRTLDGKTFQSLRWSTPVLKWREFDGRMLPVQAEAVWALPEGEFAYARFEILEVEYNAGGPEAQTAAN